MEGLLELNSCVDILHRLEIGAELGVSSKVVRFRNLAKLELLVQNERWVLDRRNLEDFIGVVPFAQQAHILAKESVRVHPLQLRKHEPHRGSRILQVKMRVFLLGEETQNVQLVLFAEDAVHVVHSGETAEWVRRPSV